MSLNAGEERNSTMGLYDLTPMRVAGVMNVW